MFISINSLEHAPDPSAFLRACAGLLSAEGIGMLAVPDFDYELRDNFLLSFVIDHLLYFSADSFRHVLVSNGFDVLELTRNDKLNVLTAYVRKRRPCDLSGPVQRYETVRKQIKDYMNTISEQGGRIALWGASHLAFSVMSVTGMETEIAYILDSAPFKQGKYAPVSGLAIVPPEHLLKDPVDTIVIMCPEYAAEIIAGIRKDYSTMIEHIASFQHGGLQIIM